MTKTLVILGCLGFAPLVGCGGRGADELSATQLAQLAEDGYLQCDRHAPPAEAIAACDGLAADAVCSFTHDDREVTGTCQAARDGSSTLHCAPDRPRHEPPAAAVAACEGLAVDAACSFTHDDREVTGTCQEARDGSGTLHCAPDRPRCDPPAEAVVACDGLEAEAACAFTLGDHDLSGTCSEACDDSGTLVCTPRLPRGCHLGRPGHHGHGHGPRASRDR